MGYVCTAADGMCSPSCSAPPLPVPPPRACVPLDVRSRALPYHRIESRSPLRTQGPRSAAQRAEGNPWFCATTEAPGDPPAALFPVLCSPCYTLYAHHANPPPSTTYVERERAFSRSASDPHCVRAPQHSHYTHLLLQQLLAVAPTPTTCQNPSTEGALEGAETA